MGWKHNAIAQCYYHSPLPALVRPFRERYQLSIPSEGGQRRLARRKEATARILYYHRVNDDRNPFLPAITTALFEQQMRFLSKHYTVVSLAELTRRLAGGLARPVVAVTFDDGYQDNYHNASPILRKYDLPATIFLTTGTMDSREPLWFERLAAGFQKTSKAVLDVEIGPRNRFPLGTEAERLEANDAVFSIVRTLPDSDRRQWLEMILQQLGVEEDGQLKDRMLTWEQAREMHREKIDFGGHTVTHPFLSRMTGAQFTWEVAECKRRIENELQIQVRHFAYPNGREEDFGPANKGLIRGAGYTAAVTTIWGTNYPATDLLELRRGGPWEPSAAQFAYKLDWYQWVNQ